MRYEEAIEKLNKTAAEELSEKLLKLDELLCGRVIGQDSAVAAVAKLLTGAGIGAGMAFKKKED